MLRVVFKFGLGGGFLIVLFAYLKSEWFYSGVYPDAFLTVVALVFAGFGMLFRQAWLKERDNVQPKHPETEEPVEPDLQTRLRQLSKRELEVLELLAAKYSNKEISARLCIEMSTIKTHINSIYRKLGVSSRKEIWNIPELEVIFN